LGLRDLLLVIVIDILEVPTRNGGGETPGTPMVQLAAETFCAAAKNIKRKKTKNKTILLTFLSYLIN
jgi:hypothetical protein